MSVQIFEAPALLEFVLVLHSFVSIQLIDKSLFGLFVVIAKLFVLPS